MRSRFCWSAAFAIFCSVGLIAQDAPQLKKMIKPENTYYPGLTDSEFKSLKPGPRFYPWVVDVWVKRPLDNEDVKTLTPKYASDEDCRRQGKVFENITNPHVQSNAIAELGASGNPVASSVLISFLPDFEDLNIIADTLRALRYLKADVRGKKLEAYLKSPDKNVRLEVMRLYAIQSYSQARIILQVTENESDARIRIAGIHAATLCADKSAFENWEKYVDGKNGNALHAAMPALIGFRELNGKKSELLRWCDSGNVLARFSIAKHCDKLDEPVAVELLKKLASDAHSSVRSEVARSIGDGKYSACTAELIKLSNDGSPEVRFSAVEAMHHFPVDSVFQALVARGGDQRKATRERAVAQLLAIKDAYPVEQKIAAAIDADQTLIRLCAYRVLRGLKSKMHGDKIARRVASETAPDNIADGMRAAVAAVGKKAENFIISKEGYESLVVRKAVAEMLGEIRSMRGAGILKKYATTDQETDVRIAALVAMAQINDQSFAPVYLTILRMTGDRDIANGNDRAAAAWAAGHLKSCPDDLSSRLVEQVTQPVVKVSGAPPMHDSTQTRVCAVLALVELSKRTGNNSITGRAKHCVSFLMMSQDEAAGMRSPPPVGADVTAYGNQILQYWKGEPIQRYPIEPRKFKFSVRRSSEQ